MGEDSDDNLNDHKKICMWITQIFLRILLNMCYVVHSKWCARKSAHLRSTVCVPILRSTLCATNLCPQTGSPLGWFQLLCTNMCGCACKFPPIHTNCECILADSGFNSIQIVRPLLVNLVNPNYSN